MSTGVPSVLFVAAAVLYGLACALYLAYLARGVSNVERWTTRTLGGAVLAHVGFVIADYVTYQHSPFEDIHTTLTFASLGTVIGFLVAVLRFPSVNVLGAFITPITLLFLLGSGLGRAVAPVPQEVRSALLPLHVGVNVIGVVAFAVAFGASSAYVIQERLVRRKQLGGIFQRLPSLDVLDTVSFRSVTIGFPLFTVGVVTGALWAQRLHPSHPILTPAQVVALLAWIVFASVLVLRVVAGWRGRRAALGTIMGFLCAVAVLAGYVARAGGGS